ncbi:MAG: Transcriptional regulator, LuxR family protein [Rhizobium sp.]|nr:Transcriptional regulator, LuxR family protein [Rhizobium sp.]
MKDEDVSDVTPAAEVSSGPRSVRRRVRQAVAGRRAVKVAVPTVATPKPKAAADGAGIDDPRRRVLADVCKVFGDHLSSDGGPGAELGLPPRLSQTLNRLVRGDSEKQVAMQLGLSRHTIHVYVKQLYKRLSVSSRGELLAKFVRGSGER